MSPHSYPLWGPYGKPKQFTKLSDYAMRQQNKLFAHTMRAPDADITRRPPLDEYKMQPLRPYLVAIWQQFYHRAPHRG